MSVIGGWVRRAVLRSSVGAALVGWGSKTVQQALDALTVGGDISARLSDVPILLVGAGQSNLLGANDGGPNPADSGVKVWDGTAGAWGSSDYTALPLSAAAPRGNGGNNMPLLATAHRLREETGRRVCVVFYAEGGTSITNWDSAGDASPFMAALHARVTAALDTPELAGVTKADALVWEQCEEDYTMTFAQYLGHFRTVDGLFRAKSWFGEQRPMLIGAPSDLHDRYDASYALRWYCAKENPWCIWVQSNGLKTEYSETGAGDFTHYLGESLWELGYYRMYAALRKTVETVEVSPPLLWGRGVGEADPAQQTAIARFSSLVGWDSVTDSVNPSAVAAAGSISWGGGQGDANYSFAQGPGCSVSNLATYSEAGGQNVVAEDAAKWSRARGLNIMLKAPYQTAGGRDHTVCDDGGTAFGLFSEYTTVQADPVMFQVGIGTSAGNRKNGVTVRKSGKVEAKNLPTYADNAAALAGGLVAGNIYKTATGELRIVV